MRSLLRLVLLMVALLGCGTVSTSETATAIPQATDLSYLERIRQGDMVWGRVDNGWNGQQCGMYCVSLGTSASITVVDGDCNFTMDPTSCQCVSAEQGAPYGMQAGCWCYGLVLTTISGNCEGTSGPSFPPPH